MLIVVDLLEIRLEVDFIAGKIFPLKGEEESGIAALFGLGVLVIVVLGWFFILNILGIDDSVPLSKLVAFSNKRTLRGTRLTRWVLFFCKLS